MGKGLDLTIIIELLFYVSASLLPLALPLAILLSSLIVMGNLGEYNELTALKSTGLSIARILRPLTFVIVFIAIGTFYFSNYIIPIANFKWHAIIWDIQETKLTSFLKPGSYTQDIDGFSIKISEGKDNKFKRIVIHDRRDPSNLKTITADSGQFYRSESGEFLFFQLHNGKVIEELSKAPEFGKEKEKKKKSGETYPGRKADFKKGTYKMTLTGLEVDRSEDELFKNDFEMLNVFQIEKTVDSLQVAFNELSDNFSRNITSKHAFVESHRYSAPKPHDIKKSKNDTVEVDIEPEELSESDTISEEEMIPFYTVDEVKNDGEIERVRQGVASLIRSNKNTLKSQVEIEESRKRNLRRFEIEFHRKFSLSFSIIILFFIGAPLGAIVKKGGFGAPVVIAALLFMVYFVLVSIGDNMAKQKIISPFLGMWGPGFILMPFSVILMIMATNDKSLADFKIKNLFNKKDKSK